MVKDKELNEISKFIFKLNNLIKNDSDNFTESHKANNHCFVNFMIYEWNRRSADCFKILGRTKLLALLKHEQRKQKQ